METKMLKWKKKWYHQVRWRSLMWTPTLLSCCSSSSTRGRWAFWIQTQIHGICDQWSMIIFKHFFRFCFFIFSTLPQVASAAYTAELLYAADKYEIHGLVKTFPNQSWAISKTHPGETLRQPVQDRDQSWHSGRDSHFGRQALPQKSQTGATDVQQMPEKRQIHISICRKLDWRSQ